LSNLNKIRIFSVFLILFSIYFYISADNAYALDCYLGQSCDSGSGTCQDLSTYTCAEGYTYCTDSGSFSDCGDGNDSCWSGTFCDGFTEPQQPPPPTGPSCGELGGDYCSGSGSCPGGYTNLGNSSDCSPCCVSPPPPPPPSGQSCGELGGDYCSGSGSCPGGYTNLGNSFDCSPCCVSPPPPPPPSSESCGSLGGDYCSGSGSCPLGYTDLGNSFDCSPCCVSPQPPPPPTTQSCGELGGDYCSNFGFCLEGYTNLGDSWDCSPCCRYSQPPPLINGLTVCPDGSQAVIIKRDGTTIFNIRADDLDNPNYPLPSGRIYDYNFGIPGYHSYTIHDYACGDESLQTMLGESVVFIPSLTGPPPPPGGFPPGYSQGSYSLPPPPPFPPPPGYAQGSYSQPPSTGGGSMSGYVYQDLNTTTCCSGIKDPGELGVPGQQIRMYNAAGTLLSTVTTDSSGFYRFSNIPNALDYRFDYTVPQGYVRTTDDSTVDDYQSNENRTHDFGIYGSGPLPVTPPPPGSPPTSPPGTPPGPVAEGAEPCDDSQVYENFMVICDIFPTTVSRGEIVQISGNALGRTVNLNGENGTIITITGTLNSDNSLLTITIPLGTALGTYGIDVIGNDTIATSNEKLFVTDSTEQPSEYGDDYDSGITNYIPTPFGIPLPFPPLPRADSFESLLTFLITYSVYLVGIAVFIMILYAGFLWLTAAANPGNIALAKSVITNAIIGAIILISSYVILYTINPQLVGGGFNLVGLTGPKPITPNGVSRLIATDEMGAATAINSGCSVATDLRELTSVSCPDFVAESLGLALDPLMEANDTNANQQINATFIQNSGNTGSGRRIVVLDTGYNRNHPELSSSYGGGWDFINKDSDPSDDHTSGAGSPGHGSHVAGIITADGNDPNAKGVAPGVQIIAGKILSSTGQGYWSDMINAIYWAINGPDGNYGTSDDFKPDVINISMGSGTYGFCDNNDETTRLLFKALEYARDHGALPVIAAGNKSSGVSLPGCLSNAFTVGAVDGSDRIANFSGTGSPVDIVAPGVNIYSALLGNNYGNKSGTSMATPFVSGVAALIKAAHPEYSVNDLENAMIATVKDLGSAGKDSSYGWGRVTANAGNTGSTPIPPPPPLPQPAPIPPNMYCTTSNSCGRMWPSTASCTKQTLSGNPDCDVTISYQATAVSLPSDISVRMNGTEVKRTTCTSLPCSGTYVSNDPSTGLYRFTLNTSNGSQIGRTNVTIFSSGVLTSNPNSSCTKNASTGNPNCDITLSTNAPGVYPAQLLITKDGSNWKLISCGSSACSETVVDPNPTVGIHTYALYDSSDGSRLSRATIFVSGGAVSPGTPPPPPCATCPPSIGILEICDPNETPSATLTCSSSVNMQVGQSVQFTAWLNTAGDRANWIDITSFARWQACNNNGPCYDSWYSSPGLFNAQAAGGPFPINSSYGGVSDQINVGVSP
jgi:hypothetical protein